jgi:hypothetical protein
MKKEDLKLIVLITSDGKVIHLPFNVGTLVGLCTRQLPACPRWNTINLVGGDGKSKYSFVQDPPPLPEPPRPPRKGLFLEIDGKEFELATKEDIERSCD